MSIGSFAIGMLTMIVFAAVIAFVLGVLKVTKLAREVLTIKKRHEDVEREIFRDVNMIEQTLRNQMNRTEESLYRAADEMFREGKAYTDKRIDKLIDTYLEIRNNTKKNLLKD